jgi:photosystem II Psb27 protein
MLGRRTFILLTLGIILWFGGWGNAPAAAGLLTRNRENVISTKELRETLNAGLTGNFEKDTLMVIGALRDTLALADGDAQKPAAVTDARYKISAYASRYRADPEKSGLYSYTTMRTALNSLASYYNSTARRSVPDKVRDRVLVELQRAETAIGQGR